MSPELAGRVVSVRAGRVASHDRPAWDEVRSEWRTAFWKQELAAAVPVGALGLAGDEQADKRHHGGPDMAVLMYSSAHYEHWRTLPGLDAMGPGGFGENLTVTGLDETTVCVGDVLAVGSARLEVASPRGPCMDISRRWNAEWLLKRVVERRHTGWYLRVPEPGEVRAGDDVRLLARPHPGWTVDRLLRIRYVTPRSGAELAEAAALAALPWSWREKFTSLPAHD